jgi:hypothetical protein
MTPAATATKPANKKPATAKKTAQPSNVVAVETKPTTTSAKPEIAKVTTGSTKAAPPARIVAYIETLTTPAERRYATKQWRFTAGHRSSAPSLRGVSPERAQVIKEAIAAAIA